MIWKILRNVNLEPGKNYNEREHKLLDDVTFSLSSRWLDIERQNAKHKQIVVDQFGFKNSSLAADSKIALKTIAYGLEQNGRLHNNKL